MVYKEDEIREAINSKGFNDGVMQLLHIGRDIEYEVGNVLAVGISNEENELLALVADTDDNHFWLTMEEIEENAYITFNRLVDEILN